MFRYVLTLGFALLAVPVWAGDALPAAVTQAAKVTLAPIGSGTFTKFGFRIYDATLWVAADKWQPHQPYALELRYARNLSQKTLVDTVIGNIRDQKTADEATLTRWQSLLTASLPEIKKGDVMIGLCRPAQPSQLYYNGQSLGEIPEAALSEAFFAIWLGDAANQKLKQKLLGISR